PLPHPLSTPPPPTTPLLSSEGAVHPPPAVLALHGAAVCGKSINRMIDEHLPVARVGAEDDGRHPHLVDLRAAPLGDHALERLGEDRRGTRLNSSHEWRAYA